MAKSKNTGKAFEAAVAQFVKALDPTAEVIRDYKGRDRDTGERQQMDVFVKAKVMGHFPVSILISCKDLKRKLDVGHIRTFCAELKDSSAHMGVIYSSSGFNEVALRKAKVNGITCCRLYQDQPAELPDRIPFVVYLARATPLYPQVEFPSGHGIEEVQWEEFLAHRVEDEQGRENSLAEVIERAFTDAESWSAQQITEGPASDGPRKVFPQGWKCTLPFPYGEGKAPVTVILQGSWQTYAGRHEAHLVNGSYSCSDGSFRGSLKSPTISVRSEVLSDQWEEVSPEVTVDPSVTVVTMFQVNLPIAEIFAERLKGKRLGDRLGNTE